ncbi:DNA polymerase III subunit delta [Sphingomonas sp. 1P06PA]|uniref:DNA polymerase III subunit delta n=1 Tax=Sphingomonas sp. 1P06PA TaxID=554121 RepID=UPI0039A430C7
MKANRQQIERAVARPDPAHRLILLYGPDESASQMLAGAVGKALGAQAERIDLTGAMLKADPARLSDEAAAISLFGDPRWIRVTPAGDEAIDAVEALLALEVQACPVVIVAGALRKDAKLVKLATSHAAAMAFASYLPEGSEADRIAIQLGREQGITLGPDVGRRIAAAAGGDRAIIAREIEKYALYLDADPAHPAELDHDALDAIGADVDSGSLDRLVDAVLGGDPAQADAEFSRLAESGTAAVPIVRAFQSRLLLLAQLRARIEAGNSAESAITSAGRGILWKSKDAILRQLSRWDSDAVATALGRIAEAGRGTMSARGAGLVAVDAELLLLARRAARRR